ncbi:hypothetical protein RQP46_001947 [Phenoliferia psychrophenolica]
MSGFAFPAPPPAPRAVGLRLGGALGPSLPARPPNPFSFGSRSFAPTTPAYILKLPTEILIKIGRSVAPQGGKACCNLSLVNRRFRAITKPIVQSAILLPAPQDQHEAALASLAAPAIRLGVKSATYSYPMYRVEISAFTLTKFSNISQLCLRGTYLPQILLDALVELGALRTLRLEGLRFDNSMKLDELSPGLRTLIISDCSFALPPPPFGVGVIAAAAVNISANKLVTLEITTDGEMTGTELSRCFQSCSTSLRQFTLGWSDQPPVGVGNAFNGTSCPQLEVLRLSGIPGLFTPSSFWGPPNADTTAVVGFLSLQMGSPNITSLSIPIATSSPRIPALFLALVFPTVEWLELNLSSAAATSTDVAIYQAFTTIVIPSSFPALRHLHIRGWSVARSAFGTYTPEQLARKEPFVSSLLASVRDMTVLDVILTSLSGQSCHFARTSREDEFRGVERFWLIHLMIESGMSGIGAIPAPQLPFILLLPDEILALIGRAVAPHGGKACCNLSLVSRRLRAITKPIVQSAILIPAPQDQHEAALAHLAAPKVRLGVTSATYHIPTSQIEYSVYSLLRFTNITDLVLCDGGAIPTVLLDSLVELPALRTLRLENITELFKIYNLDLCAPNLHTLSLINCSFVDDVAQRGPMYAIDLGCSTRLTSLDVWQVEGRYVERRMTGMDIAGYFETAGPSLRRFNLGWSGQPPRNVHLAFGIEFQYSTGSLKIGWHARATSEEPIVIYLLASMRTMRILDIILTSPGGQRSHFARTSTELEFGLVKDGEER